MVLDVRKVCFSTVFRSLTERVKCSCGRASEKLRKGKLRRGELRKELCKGKFSGKEQPNKTLAKPLFDQLLHFTAGFDIDDGGVDRPA